MTFPATQSDQHSFELCMIDRNRSDGPILLVEVRHECLRATLKIMEMLLCGPTNAQPIDHYTITAEVTYVIECAEKYLEEQHKTPALGTVDEVFNDIFDHLFERFRPDLTADKLAGSTFTYVELTFCKLQV